MRAHAPLKKGDWLLGISIDKKKRPVPHRARIVEAPTPGSFFKLDAPLPAGTALFDMNGQLVGLVVKPPRAAPVDAIRAVLQSAPEPAP